MNKIILYSGKKNLKFLDRKYFGATYFKAMLYLKQPKMKQIVILLH